jgi:hypothetical protein
MIAQHFSGHGAFQKALTDSFSEIINQELQVKICVYVCGGWVGGCVVCVVCMCVWGVWGVWGVCVCVCIYMYVYIHIHIYTYV